MMLTGNKLLAKNYRGRLLVSYLDPSDSRWGTVVEWILSKGKDLLGQSRSVFEEEINEYPGSVPDALVFAGLVKVFSDNCTFEQSTEFDAIKIRELVFSLASNFKQEGKLSSDIEVRKNIFELVGKQTEVDPNLIDALLYSDLESENKLLAIPKVNAQNLMHRYNLSLAQGALLNSLNIVVKLPSSTPPARLRQLTRWLKFQRLLCAVDKNKSEGLTLQIDGPLSLFRTTQKYGFQIALFLPALLLCPEFELEAELLWGKTKKPCKFQITSNEGLVTHYADSGMYRPPENDAFLILFKKRIDEWDISDTISDLDYSDDLLIPDFVLKRKTDQKIVGLEILWNWNTVMVERRIKDMEKLKLQKYVLAVADKGNLGKDKLAQIPKSVYLFKSSPLPQEIEKIINAF
jgi:predicted nuclease of restriction endonuclease-like RecB superfamily